MNESGLENQIEATQEEKEQYLREAIGAAIPKIENLSISPLVNAKLTLEAIDKFITDQIIEKNKHTDTDKNKMLSLNGFAAGLSSRERVDFMLNDPELSAKLGDTKEKIEKLLVYKQNM